MSAALCGPTDALSSLQKHTTTDRSHQQDHFRSAPVRSSQGFRSGPVQSSGLIDNEFEHFADRTQPVYQPPQVAAGLNIDQPPIWANDFQRLNTSPAPHFEFAHASQEVVKSPAWLSEYGQQRRDAEVMQAQHVASHSSFAMPVGNPMGYSRYTQQLDYSTSPPVQQPEFQFDESAFEKAFQDAARELEFSQLKLEENLHGSLEQTVSASAAAEKATEKEPLAREPDDLALTAGKLLDSVQNNSSRKFQNSNFLALMRKLRDHEAVVEGDKIVQVR